MILRSRSRVGTRCVEDNARVCSYFAHEEIRVFSRDYLHAAGRESAI